MEFLQPILLWGLLGLSIPVAIHLWNGKKGRTVSWAAMAWLTEQENQSSKSIRLDQLLVLILRLIMLILLVFLLSKLILKSWLLPDESKTVHLVAPYSQVFEAYRFEIERAKEAGQEVYWLEPELSDINSDLSSSWMEKSNIQKTLNKLEGSVAELHVYLPNTQSYLPKRPINSPIKPVIHLAKSAKIKSDFSPLKLDSIYVLEQNELGVLNVSNSANQNQSSEDLIRITYYLGNLSAAEENHVQAAFRSLSEVMKIKSTEVEQLNQANLVFDREEPEKLDYSTLYFVLSNPGISMKKNEVLMPDQLDFEHSEILRNGQLPEFILENYLKFLGIPALNVEMTQTQLEARFIPKEVSKEDKKSGIEIILVALLVLTYGAERYFSNQRGI